MGKNGRTCDQTHQSSFSLYEEYFLKVSSKSDDPKSRYIEEGIFWDQIWSNLGLNDVHAWARMGEHVTKLISLHSFHTKNISTKFHLNLMKKIQDILETFILDPISQLPRPLLPFLPFISRTMYRRKILLYSI